VIAANGLDKEAAISLIKSKRAGADPESAMVGPWHYAAASKAVSGV